LNSGTVFASILTSAAYWSILGMNDIDVALQEYFANGGTIQTRRSPKPYRQPTKAQLKAKARRQRVKATLPVNPRLYFQGKRLIG
jgi:hypothetical protein